MQSGTTYLLRKKILQLIGASFEITDSDGNIILYVKQEGFKLKEEIKFFTSQDMTQEVLYIKARNVIDFSGTYDVFDSETNTLIGTLQRNGLKSVLQDSWTVLDSNGNEKAKVSEDSLELALIRRFIQSLVPQNYDLNIGDEKFVDLKQNFNPFVYKLNIIILKDGIDNYFDSRLVFAMAVMLGAIEGRQS